MSLNIHELQTEIYDQYLNDDNPRAWIIGFSGGKDSTMLLQVVWNTLLKIDQKKRKRPIYVVCNNTLVENPRILDYTERVLNLIESSAIKQKLPFSVHRTTPKLEDTFWVNLIGRGYPAPNRMFRWCTERLKISPTTAFIIEKINAHGEAIILLGTRSDESSNRARSIKRHSIYGQRLSKHSLPNAYVYAPIKDVTTDEVWLYLSQVPSPWGASNRELITLYKNASSGDCPLVIDKSSPSCGTSRFGCWVCTVVNSDKSMSALVTNGETWLEPLLEFRNFLADSRWNPKYREKNRRNVVDSKGIMGPYTIKFRAILLDKLLQAQKEIQKTQQSLSLISYQELVAIQVSWYRDNNFFDSVANIYNNIFDKHISLVSAKKYSDENRLLEDLCEKNPLDYSLIQDLLLLQKSKTILMKNRGLPKDLENRLSIFIREKSS